MKNPFKIYWVPFEELFPIRIIVKILVWWLVFFWLWGLWSQMLFVYIWLWLIALSILIFILCNISRAIKLFNEWKLDNAVLIIILMVGLTWLTGFIGYNLYLSLTF